MITVSEALETLEQEGFDIIIRDSVAPNVPSRYRIEHLRIYVPFFLNEQQLIAFVEGYKLGLLIGEINAD